MLQRPVADVPAVEEQVLHPVVAAALARMGRRSPTAAPSPSSLSTQIRFVGQISRPKNSAIRSRQSLAGGSSNTGRSLCRRVKWIRGIGQGDPRERLADVAQLGLRGAQELAPHRRVEEQIADLDGRADRAAAGHDRPELARR